jgi:hypothetical protein
MFYLYIYYYLLFIYSYGQYVAERIPLLKGRVRREVTEQLASWLIQAREAAVAVGRAALMEGGEGKWGESPSLYMQELREGLPEDWRGGGVSFREQVEGAGHLPLGTPHQCYYIYERLGEKPAFVALYTEARRVQARMTKGKTSLDSLCGVVGFFVIEDAVGLRLLDESALQGLWDAAVLGLSEVLQPPANEQEGDRHNPEDEECARLAQQVRLAERVARGLYLPLDRLHQAGKSLGQGHIAQRARKAGHKAGLALREACGEAPLSWEEWDQKSGNRREKYQELLGLERGQSLPFTRGVLSALQAQNTWLQQAHEWVEGRLGWEKTELDESLAEGNRHFGAALQQSLRETKVDDRGGLGAIVQLLVDAQYVCAGVGIGEDGSSIVLGEELATAWQGQFRAQALLKLEQLVGEQVDERESLLEDVWPYLEAILPPISSPHLPRHLLLPLRVAGLLASCDILQQVLSSDALYPKQVKLLQHDAQGCSDWRKAQGIPEDPAEVTVLLQLAALLGSGGEMSQFLESSVWKAKYNMLGDGAAGAGRMSTQVLISWLSRLREEGSGFFGGAKVDKNAESLAKKLKNK